MTTAVNSFLQDYSSRVPRNSALTLSPRTLACEGRRTLLLNHVVDVSSIVREWTLFLLINTIDYCLITQRPSKRMNMLQLCINEENRQSIAAKTMNKRRRGTMRTSCYYVIPKVHISSEVLFKRHVQEQLVDAQIVERLKYTQALSARNVNPPYVAKCDDNRHQLPPLESTLSPSQRMFSADVEDLCNRKHSPCNVVLCPPVPT